VHSSRQLLFPSHLEVALIKPSMHLMMLVENLVMSFLYRLQEIKWLLILRKNVEELSFFQGDESFNIDRL
jgi:hypothetical protein